ncbi:MAG: SDR family NAD(P)-dependent oxidoreductase [Vulcanimicrobiota bacterium]
MKEPLLADKKVLVTGGSRGLGRSLCQTFAAEGAQVAFNFSSDEAGAQQTLRELPQGRAFQVSVTDEAGLNQMVSELEKEWGALDILVNNAGISQPLPLALMEAEDWDAVMDVNVKGYFIATRAAVRGMIRRKAGCILNIGSLAGLRLIEAPIHYSASKAAVKGFTEALAKEIARYNIRVNCLAPGLLDDGVGRNLPEHRLKEYLKHVALHRVGKLDEVARLAAFLASDRNSYMTGATILMDGGL